MDIKVGVSVIICHEGQVLMGKRKGSHGEGCWSFPGGHLEPNETAIECVIRETYEETGLHVELVEPLTFTDDFFDEGLRYITLFFRGVLTHVQEPELREPEKCFEWQWFDQQGNPPKPLFLPIRNLQASGYHIWSTECLVL
jgi:8-oxo-dGTP diphosphatase